MAVANPSAEKSARQRNKSNFFRRVRQHWQLYALLLIPLIYLAVFQYWPMTGRR